MSYRVWEPIGRLHIPGPITNEQLYAAATLKNAAQAGGGYVHYESGMTKSARDDEERA